MSAGIDCDKMELVRSEVLRQLELCAKGEFTDRELNAAKQALISGLRATHDSPGAIEGYYATAALSGAERGLSRKYSGIYPVEIVANTLRMLGQGTKVCVEIAMMALDNGAIAYGRQVIAVGGTGRGADTVCRLTPDYTADLLGTRIHEILCKPSLEDNA